MPTCETEDDDPAKSQTPTTPQRSPAIKHPRNGSGDGKAAANKAAGPRNAPGRGKAGGKKAEPTLLSDFLLGRPSVDRVRRRSSAVAPPPAEVKASAVQKLQPPGGVKYRVKQWQQSSAAAVIEDPATPAKKPDGDYLNSDEEKQQEPHINPPLAVKPEKRKTPLPMPPRARGTPRKRVVSDSHWVRNRKKSPQTKQEILLNRIVDPVANKKNLATKADKTDKADSGKRLPKDFVKSNWANPPLERKIQDWASRIDGPQAASHSGTAEEAADTLPTSISSSSATKAETPATKAKTPATKTKTPKTPEKVDKSKRLPKDFVKSNWANPPLQRKIQDWAERTATHNEIPPDENSEETSGDKPEEMSEEKPEEQTESISDSMPPPAKPINLKRTPAKKNKPKPKTKTSPKEFVESILAKPPLERKIQGWMGLTDKLNNTIRGESPETVVYPDLSAPAKSTTLKRGPAGRKSKPKGLPKDFVESNWANPPLERKMQDWAARVNVHDTVPHDEKATELEPNLPTDPSTLNSKSVTGTRSPHGIRKGYVEANSVNPPVDRKIQDWVERTNNSDIASSHEERPKVTPRKVSRHIDDGKSSEVQKSTGGTEPLGVAGAKVMRESPLSQPPAPSDIDSALDIRPMSQNQIKEETMEKAREDRPKRNKSKSKIGRRGAIHGTVRTNTKRFDPVQDQDGTKQSDDTESQPQSRVDRDLRLAKEELARRQDRLANNKDPTRARDLQTLAPLKGAQIDQTRHVKAKEYFDLDLRHSNGQRMACEVELIVRDSDHDTGDILICEVNARRSHYLLFQPLVTDQISVRRGDMEDDLIVMARSQDDAADWQECFILKAEDPEVVEEFMVMFRDKPVPPAISRFDPEPLGYTSPDKALMSGALVCPDSPDVPIGEHAGFRDQTPQSSPRAVDPFVSADGYNVSKERAEYRLSKTPTQRDRAIEPVSSQTTPTRYRPRSKELSLATPTKSYPNKDSNEKSGRSPTPPGSVSKSTSTAPALTSNIEPPPPPLHKQKSSRDVATELQSPHSASYEPNQRRSSSPLKHEYQPSEYTTSSSTSYLTDSEDDDSTLESSGDGLTGTEDIASQLQQVDDAVLPDIRLEPPQASYCLKFKSNISCWRVPPGRWDNIHLDLCSIVITPGLIEAYALEASHPFSTDSLNNVQPRGRPLIALVLTPIVMIRQSNALDVEIHSQPLETSTLKSTHIVRFRARNKDECMALYAATHKARQDNEKYNRLQRDRILNDYSRQSDNEWDDRKARYSWFGRKKSYRASARASSNSGSDGSTFSLGRTAVMALRRMSNGANYDNGRLTPNMSRFEGGPRSRGSSIFGASESAPSSSPRTRTDSSLAASSTRNSSVFDTNNLIVRVYRSEKTPRWVDLGYCRILIRVPQPGMSLKIPMNDGVPKHITLIQHTGEKQTILSRHLGTTNSHNENKEPPIVFYDGVSGSRDFTRVNKIGIVMHVQQEVYGTNGEVGLPGAIGGVGIRQRKWMFKSPNATQCGWVFALLGGGV
ncbi:hypothetical protein V496_05930 [Pseudogymnoascus sp. VKM F-4515 (FW-2607)]|nr:hypothetical protein V496_05930 [Pseudogymnoascus sp. VKM F-4515 (FW-2607)]